jgi:DNA invertase Pin-like site-specific DNA recombinase
MSQGFNQIAPLVHAADMPGADDLMMRVYAAMAQNERELISERTKAARAPRATAELAAHRVLFEVDRLPEVGVVDARFGACAY